MADHNPPHFHAIYAEHEALIRISDGLAIRGDLPRTAARLVEQWRVLHRDELASNLSLSQEPATLSGIEPLQWSVEMSVLARVTDVECVGQREIRITFSDGIVRELDFAGALTGLLATLNNDATFAGVSVDAVAGTVCWANGIDLDPDVLHGDDTSASAIQPRLIREYRMQETG